MCSQGNRPSNMNHTSWATTSISHGIAAPIAHTQRRLTARRIGGINQVHQCAPRGTGGFSRQGNRGTRATQSSVSVGGRL